LKTRRFRVGDRVRLGGARALLTVARVDREEVSVDWPGDDGRTIRVHRVPAFCVAYVPPGPDMMAARR
jgi:hypothetical protein